MVVMVDMGSPVAASPRGGRGAVSRARRRGTRVRLNFTNHVFSKVRAGAGARLQGVYNLTRA